ncbi:collagen-like protein [Corynebacterium aurimucosum]|nr:collagen-like protein [Corynebacterium aurimucosum]
MRSLHSRIVATAVAVATFSSVIVAPQAFAVEEPSETAFVHEQSGADTVDVNGTAFDEDGNLIDSNNAGDNIIEELDRESRGNDFGFYGAENGKPTTLDELKTAEASTADATIKVVEKNGKLVCEITDVPGKEGEILERKLDLARAFYDGGNKLLQTVWEVIPVVGELVPSDFIKKIGASSWEGIAKLVRDGEADKDVTWDLARAQGMAIAKINNADAEVDLKNPDAAKKTVSGLIKFADGAFGNGVATVLKIFNAAVTIAGLFPGASAAKDLKLNKTQRKEIESTLSDISASASALAEINAPAGQKCADMLNGKKVSNDKPASPSTSNTTEPSESPASSEPSSLVTPSPSETTEPEESESETPTTTEPSTSTTDGAEAQDGKDGKDGEPGRDGKDGKDGIDGKDGRDGANGAPGAPGRDGVDGQDGRDGLNGLNGRDGADGKDGKDGQDGKGVDSSSMAGYTFLAAILGGGLVVSILGAMDYLYLLGYLPKEGIPWRANS